MVQANNQEYSKKRSNIMHQSRNSKIKQNDNNKEDFKLIQPYSNQKSHKNKYKDEDENEINENYIDKQKINSKELVLRSPFNANKEYLKKTSKDLDKITKYSKDERKEKINAVDLTITQLPYKTQKTNTKFDSIKTMKKYPSINENDNEEQKIENSEPITFKETSVLIELLENNAKFVFTKAGALFGRNADCDICIKEETISRKHAEIKLFEGNFYVKDLGSTSGTAIKLNSAMELSSHHLFEFGNFLLEIKEKGDNFIKYEIVSQYDDYDFQKKGIISFKDKNSCIFGSGDCDITLKDPQNFVSNRHFEIYKENQKYCIRDLNSINGTWKCLGKNNPFKLTENLLFKLGDNAIFKVKKLQIFKEESKINIIKEEIKDSETVCVICFENSRNTVLWPCKHSVICIDCSEHLKICPICRTSIESVIKIE